MGLSTTTLCWVSTNNAAATTCNKRRKRFLIGETESDIPVAASPSQKNIADEDNDELLESGQTEINTDERKGKFLLYWLTTTSTSTTTITDIECTPAGFTMSNCAGK